MLARDLRVAQAHWIPDLMQVHGLGAGCARHHGSKASKAARDTPKTTTKRPPRGDFLLSSTHMTGLGTRSSPHSDLKAHGSHRLPDLMKKLEAVPQSHRSNGRFAHRKAIETLRRLKPGPHQQGTSRRGPKKLVVHLYMRRFSICVASICSLKALEDR